ncbi:glycosyl hydrolase family 28 protein (plasmid) [Methylobacterium sp. CB376]|uniref:glycoside hydrolase family 28 protein n=1 Tax=unclassified Methylobacterium TaxID=2615210 RepID=UPI00223EA9F7|nr:MULTISPECIES: glycosyl hydrolase family 28 protein [Methylobacterium]WFT83807.1 glycosyl hydrolase family 28 protein [Methylobacterium nodulans]
MTVGATHSAQSQDRRNVQEPVPPTQVCAVLSADDAPSAKVGQAKLQAALDGCRTGQAVRLTPSRTKAVFASGPIEMRAGVVLWLDAGAVLAAEPDPRLYDLGDGRCGLINNAGGGCRPFLNFHKANGAGLMGDGTIDGQGGAVMIGKAETWWALASRAQVEGREQNVPRLVQIDSSNNITVYRITLRNAPNVHIAMNKVQGVTVWGVTINTPADARNTDGIDPGAAMDVTIARTFISTGDDDIAIKAGDNGATRHVSILDIHIYSGHGLSIGSETNSGVSDVLVRNVTIDGAVSGLRIKSDPSRGGLVQAVRYENVCVRGSRRPIDFDTRYDPRAQGTKIPVYSNIVLRQVAGEGGRLVMHGYDAAHPLGVSLDGVRFVDNATWDVVNTQAIVMAGGVTPPIGAPAAAWSAVNGPNCKALWTPFPGDTAVQSH